MPKDDKGCAKQAVLSILGLLAFAFMLARCMGLPMTPADYLFLTAVAQFEPSPTTTATLPPAVALPTFTPVPTLPPNPQLGSPPKAESSSSASAMTRPPNPCIQPPQIFDPPNERTFAATSTILRWHSDYELQLDECIASGSTQKTMS